MSRQISLLFEICRFLIEQQIQSYLVGGIVRDALLDRETVDIDLAINGNALELASSIANTIGGTYVLLDEINRIGRVVVNEASNYWTFDFSSLRGNIENDLSERDFTINALAIDINYLTTISDNTTSFYKELRNMPIIDPFHGQDDLNKGIIRVVNQQVFIVDSVRLLRAVRLIAELGFEIDSMSELLLKRDAKLIVKVAGERIRDELIRLSVVSASAELYHYMDELGLLTALIPELIPARDTTQPIEHVWNVLEHSLNMVIAVEFLLHRGAWPYIETNIISNVPWSEKLAEHFEETVSHGSNRRILLKLSALLHDNAKPRTKVVNEDGKVRFIGHDREGAIISTQILERLRFSTREIRFVEICIKYHLRPTQLTQEGLPSRRALYRYFRDTGEAAIDILFLSLADHLATRGPLLDLALWQEHVKLIEYVLSEYCRKGEVVRPPKLIDGHDLINIFDLRPGPLIGELLESVREANAADEISTREEALHHIQKFLKDRTGK
jgi:poly(A) polymerase